jgi:hypothetical protein
LGPFVNAKSLLAAYVVEDSTAAWTLATMPLVILISRSRAGQTQLVVTPAAAQFIPARWPSGKLQVTSGVPGPSICGETAVQDGLFKIETLTVVSD